ncbi:MAG TPA: 2-dehydro-3-deoxygalactonokinase, partial [Ideonella sp.]|nr:2-dehydro-3-deoxygalactonokinase [Ideonella sp.]
MTPASPHSPPAVAGTAPALLALDWGTSSLRAYLLGEGGTILETRSSNDGIMRVQNGAFVAALEESCGDWLRAQPGVSLLMAGMIGSKQGWLEAP